jgi:hypothetical protein
MNLFEQKVDYSSHQVEINLIRKRISYYRDMIVKEVFIF